MIKLSGGNCDSRVSISPTFYKQLLGIKIPKAQKTVKLSVFFTFSGCAGAKAAHRTLMKLSLVAIKYLILFCWSPTTTLTTDLDQVSISSTFLHAFFVRMSFRQLFSSYMYIEKAAKMMFVRKRRTFNDDEIDTSASQPTGRGRFLVGLGKKRVAERFGLRNADLD